MTEIVYRYRDYKNGRQGTYMYISGQEPVRISTRQMSLREINEHRRNMIATMKGYAQKNAKTLAKQVAENKIVEIKDTGYNTEVAEIIQQENGQWKKEKAEDRNYIDYENARPLEQILNDVEQPNQETE